MSGDHDALLFAADNPAASCAILGIDGSFSRRLGAQRSVRRDGTPAGKRLGRYALDVARALESDSTPIIVTSDIAPDFAREAAEQGVARSCRRLCSARECEKPAVAAGGHAARQPRTLAHLAALSAFPSAVRHADSNPGIPACFPPPGFPRCRHSTANMAQSRYCAMPQRRRSTSPLMNCAISIR